MIDGWFQLLEQVWEKLSLQVCVGIVRNVTVNNSEYIAECLDNSEQ
jgi:hypothetical protein